MANIYDNGYTKLLERRTIEGSPLSFSAEQSGVGSYQGGLADLIGGSGAQGTTSGSVLGISFSGKTSFTDTTEGMREGIDIADGLYKWVMGGPTDSIDWSVTTAGALTISGSLIASQIHIPDENTTANSFHVETDGDTWWGTTHVLWTADPNNSNAYVLATGVARFASVTVTSGSSTITGGALVGNWITTADTLYGLASGTPSAAPADGIVLTSGATSRIDIYEDTELRVRLGNLSAGVYGLRGFATNGTTTIFELSDTLQQIAGWNFTDTVLRTGATDAASNVLIDSANSLMRLGPTTGNFITMDGANLRIRSSTYSAGVSGFTVEPTLIEAENLVARGIMRGSTFMYDVISAVGGQVMIANSDTLASDMTALDASTLTTRGTTTWAVNDIMVIRQVTALGIQEEWLRVTNIAAAPTYTVTRDLAGSFAADTNPIWQAGTTVVRQGSSDGAAAFSGGWLRLIGEGTNSPHYSVYSRTGVAYNAFTERVRIGNLNGYLGYVADIFGVGMGSSAAGEANITIDPTNGIRIRTGTTNLFVVDNAGTATIGSFTLAATTISATNLSIVSGAANTAHIEVGTGSNLGGLNSGNAAGDIGLWLGDTFANRAIAPLRATMAGALTVSTITITGGSISGITDLAIADGGTGASTALAGFNALSPVTTRGDLITRDATNNIRLAVGGAARFLRSDGTDPSWGGASFRYATTLGATSITNTVATEQTITSWTITGGDMGTAGVLKITFNWDLVSGGSGPTFTWRVAYGGTTFFTFVGGSQGTAEVVIANNASASAQNARGCFWNDAGVATSIVNIENNNTGVVASGSNQTLAITGQMTTAASDSTMSVYNVVVELIN